MSRMIHVGFNPTGAPKLKELEPNFTQLGDWIRYSSTGWLVWTEFSTQQVSDYLRPLLVGADQMIVLYVDATDAQGWMPQWVWNWVQSKQGVGLLGAIPPNPFLPR